MRIAITTWGSRGDFQPYLALAHRFARAGHEVRLGSPPIDEFIRITEEHGVEFVPLGPPLQATELQAAANRAFEIGDPLSQVRIIMDELMLPSLEKMYEDCIVLGRWADGIISHFFQPAGRMAADKLDLPYISGTLIPIQLPTAFHPPRKLPNVGKTANKLFWKIATFGMNAVWGDRINRVRQRVGLAPFADLAGDGFYSPHLNLVAASRHVVPVAPDWAPRHRLTGYWFSERQDWSPPPEVEAFIEEGPRPIYIGFGSMAARDGARLTEVVLDAVRRSGVRALLNAGWSDLGSGSLPAEVMRVEGIPHNWIFTKVGAIVHHGGVGTAAAAFRAGVPSVFVPHIFDQEYWGERAFELGVAPPPINRKDLSAERLSAAVRQATGAAGMREKAVRLAEALRGEDGTGNAVSLAEAYFNDGHVAVVKGESLRERGGEGNEEAAGDIENASPLLARE